MSTICKRVKKNPIRDSYNLPIILGEEGSTANVKKLVHQVMPIFLECICVVDHTVPKTALDKITELIKRTNEEVFTQNPPTGGLGLDRVQLALRYVYTPCP